MAKSAPPALAPQLVSEHGKSAGYVTVKTHQRAAPTKKTPPAPTPTPRSAPTDVVGSQVTAAQLPQVQQINAAQAASKTAAENAATTTQGYYSALANILTGVGPATQAGYQSAAGDQSAFAKGLSDGMAHIQSQTQSEGAAAAAQTGNAAPAPAGPGATNALYMTGGIIPSTSLETQGAAFGAAANMLPATAAGQGAATIQGIGAQQAVDQRGFTKQLSDLAAQVPGLRAQYQSAADSLAAKDAATAAHEADVHRQQQISYILATGIGPDGKLTPKAQIELGRVTGYINGQPTAATVAAQGRLDIAKVNAQTAQERLTLAQQRQFSDLYGHDANGNLTLPGQKAALAEYKATHSAAKGGFTKNQLANLSGKASKLADTYFYGTQDKVSSSGTVTSHGIPAIQDYQRALKLELSNGIPLSIAQRALNALYPIGKEGRPWVDITGRMLLEHSGFPMTDPLAVPSRAQAAYLNAHGYYYSGEVGPDTVATPYPPPAGR